MPELLPVRIPPDRMGRGIVMHRDDAFRSMPFVTHVASELGQLDVSRRKVPDLIATTVWSYKDEIWTAEGSRFYLGPDDIDSAFNDEGSFRWISNFLKLPERPWKQAPQTRVIDRLHLITVTLMIRGKVLQPPMIVDRFTMPDKRFIDDGIRSKTVLKSVVLGIGRALRLVANAIMYVARSFRGI